jgi:hypothetical protein
MIYAVVSATISLGIGVAFAAFLSGYAQIKEKWGNQIGNTFLVFLLY